MRNFIRRTAAALAVLCMAALLLGTPTEAEERTYSAGGEAVGYYAGWAAYQGFTPDQIPAEHLTQINYAFAQIDPDTLTIALENPAHDQKNLAALRKLRQQNQHLKLLISVGGWSDSQYFSDAGRHGRPGGRASLPAVWTLWWSRAWTGWTWTGSTRYPGGAAGDHPPPGGQAELHSAASGAAGAAGSAGPPGREGLCPHYRRRRRELVLKPDRGREGGRHCGPHLRDGL